MRTRPCVSCGALVYDPQSAPYPGHKDGCALVKEWTAKPPVHVDHNWQDGFNAGIEAAAKEADKYSVLVRDRIRALRVPG